MTPFDYLQVQSWVREAGRIALTHFQTQLHRQQKADYSPVTEADKAVEDFIIGKIEQTYGWLDHGFIAEESGGDWQGKEFVWAIDPIDGTRVFIDGLPLWCISIGLLRRGEPYRGVVYLPTLDEKVGASVHGSQLEALLHLPEEGIDLNQVVNEVERNLICQSLERTGGNKGQAARLLFLKRTTLVEKLRRMNLLEEFGR